MSAWLLRFVALYGVWLALVDNHQRLELIVGGLAAAAAATLAAFVTRAGEVRQRVRARWLVRSLAFPYWIVRDTAIVLASLVRSPRATGRSVAAAWPEEDDHALAEGRFAVAGYLGSFGPNSYAIGHEDEVLVVHQLVPADDVTPARVVDR
jgi:hypothetical protein